MKNIYKILIFIILIGFSFNDLEAKSWKFVVFGDSHIPSSDTLLEMLPFIEAENPDLILVAGDLVDGGLKCTATELLTQLMIWKNAFDPLLKKGIKIYPIRGNHEDDAKEDISVWNDVFTGDWQLPQNGPSNEIGLTYSFTHKNAKFIALDNYLKIHEINQEWLEKELSLSSEQHIFVYAHEAAFKVFHTDCLDDSLEARDKFWKSMTNNGVRAFFCGHDHFYNVSRIDDGDNNSENDIFQFLIGTGGGWLMPKHNLNGNNSNYKPIEIVHKIEHGYGIVEINGESINDRSVQISWKGRKINQSTNKAEYLQISEIINYNSNRILSEIDEEIDQSKNLISPNPADDYIEISLSPAGGGRGWILPDSPFFKGGKGVSLEIFNILGEKTTQTSLSPVEGARIFIGDLMPGIYFIKIGDRFEKFVKL